MIATGTTLAYNYVAMLLMLAEVNSFSAKTGLKSRTPLTESDVRAGSHVGLPPPAEFAGSIITDTHFYGFVGGHLANFWRRDFHPASDAATEELNLKLASLPAVIDTNQAYKLATNWLQALGVSTSAMKEKYRFVSVQWQYYPDAAQERPVMLPVYQLEWRGRLFPAKRSRDTAVVTVTILGPGKELIEYHVLDRSLFLAPGVGISDAEPLLKMSDEDFRRLGSAERAKLALRFTEQKSQRLSKPEKRPGSASPRD